MGQVYKAITIAICIYMNLCELARISDRKEVQKETHYAVVENVLESIFELVLV